MWLLISVRLLRPLTLGGGEGEILLVRNATQSALSEESVPYPLIFSVEYPLPTRDVSLYL